MLENIGPLVASKEYSRLVTFRPQIYRYSRRSERSDIQNILCTEQRGLEHTQVHIHATLELVNA